MGSPGRNCDGSRVVTASYDWTAKICDAATGECLLSVEGHQHRLYSVVYCGVYVLTSSSDYTAKLWDAVTGVCKRTFGGSGEDLSNSAGFSSDGAYVFFATSDDTCNLWDINADVCRTFRGYHEGAIHSCLFSDNGSIRASEFISA